MMNTLFVFAMFILNSQSLWAGACKHIDLSNEEEQLLEACQMGYTEVAFDLLSNGIYPNICNENHYTCLHLAAMNGHTSIIEYLLQKGAQLRTRTKDHLLSPIHLAAISGKTQIHTLETWNVIVSFFNDNLSSYDAINAKDSHGNTPLHYAFLNGYLKVAEFLLLLGANRNAINLSEKTPRELVSGQQFAHLWEPLDSLLQRIEDPYSVVQASETTGTGEFHLNNTQKNIPSPTSVANLVDHWALSHEPRVSFLDQNSSDELDGPL